MSEPQVTLRVELQEVESTSTTQLSLDLKRRDVSYVHFRSRESARSFQAKLAKLMQDSADATLIAGDEA